MGNMGKALVDAVERGDAYVVISDHDSAAVSEVCSTLMRRGYRPRGPLLMPTGLDPLDILTRVYYVQAMILNDGLTEGERITLEENAARRAKAEGEQS